MIIHNIFSFGTIPAYLEDSHSHKKNRCLLQPPPPLAQPCCLLDFELLFIEYILSWVVILHAQTQLVH